MSISTDSINPEPIYDVPKKNQLVRKPTLYEKISRIFSNLYEKISNMFSRKPDQLEELKKKVKQQSEEIDNLKQAITCLFDHNQRLARYIYNNYQRIYNNYQQITETKEIIDKFTSLVHLMQDNKLDPSTDAIQINQPKGVLPKSSSLEHAGLFSKLRNHIGL